MWNRRLVLGATMGLASVGGVVRAQWPASSPNKRVTVHLQDHSHIKQLPLLVALQLGYFRAEGLEVILSPLGAVAAFESDVVSSSFDFALRHGGARSWSAFAMLGRAPQVVLAQPARMVRSSGGVAYLRGRTIGVPGLGSVSHQVAELVLYRAGVRSQEVSFVDLADISRLLEAFYAGEIDAISFTDPWVSLLERRGDIRVLSDTRSLREVEQLFGGPVPCTCLMATPEFIREHGPTCQALSNGVVRALKWLQTAGPADLIRLLPESYLQGDRSLFLDAFNKSREAFATDGLIPAGGPEHIVQLLGQLHAGWTLERGQLNQLWTNRFVERSKAIYRI